jgi:hypothetical protein
LLIVPGLIVPGQRISVGTRYPPSRGEVGLNSG